MAIKTNKKVTMEDLAKRLNISKNAVSLALNDKPGVSEELRDKVIDLANRLDYGKLSAQNQNKSKCIIVVVPEYIQNDTYFYSDVFWAIEHETKKLGYISIMSGVSQSAQRDLVLPMLPHDMHILGVLVIGIVSNSYLKKLYELNVPMVTVDISYNSIDVNSVTSSNLNGGFNATQHLIDLGHREIGFIGPIYTAQSVYERWCGFNQALLKNNLICHENYNIVGQINHFELFDTIPILERYLDNIASYPTAWFCAGDRIAIALINILTKKNIQVPSEISVIGFDDIPISQIIHPTLTTIKVNRKLMGKLAVERLIAIQSDTKRVVDMKLPGVLVVRSSTKEIG